MMGFKLLSSLKNPFFLRSLRTNPFQFHSRSFSAIPFNHEFRGLRILPRVGAVYQAKRGMTLESQPHETPLHHTGPATKYEFQAETRKLLDIVARSLYTEKEVFVRELISNSSDALEKLRHMKLSNQEISQPDLPLEIQITTDSNAKTLTIQDTGIGMGREELIENLGRIGHSGSLNFLKSLEGGTSSTNIIGQFGVGFYSTFMVGSQVEVFSKSAKLGSKGFYWKSEGTGTYEISEVEGFSRGTKIIVHLTPQNIEYATKEVIERVIKKYSNFVGFPIKLNGETINTVKALWTLSKDQITEEDHKEFYQFIAHSYDSPTYHLHYATDSPLSIRSLFYIGQQHGEKYGMGRLEPGVNLFSKKVLIQPKAKGLLPDWLRFIRGVVDSEDIPLNISREHLQDSALIQRIGNVLTKRILKWLDEEGRKDPAKYETFFKEFGVFLREGVCTDIMFKEDIAKLLRAESSKTEGTRLTSLDDYISRMTPDQKEIYYLCVPSRNLAETSPYYESFKAANKEVLFLYTNLDDFVMTNLGEYKKYKVISIEAAEHLDQEKGKEAAVTDEIKEFTTWMKDVLAQRVSSIEATDRLIDSPAIIVDHESAAFRRMMKYVDPQRAPELPKQQLKINPNHEVIKGLDSLRKSDPSLAELIANQVFDNALIAAGLLDDARSMLPRMNQLLSKMIKQKGVHEAEIAETKQTP